MQPENVYPRGINITLFDQINCLSDQMKVSEKMSKNELIMKCGMHAYMDVF